MKPNRGSVEWFDNERRDITELTRAIDSFASASRALSKLIRFHDFLDEDLKSSLFSSAVVSYARPFSANRTSDGKKYILPKKAISSCDGYSDAHHQHLLDLRNKIIAHHDSDFVGASIVYHYIRLRSDFTDTQIVRGGSAIARSVNFPSSASPCHDIQVHIRSVLESAGQFLKHKFNDYLRETNESPEDFAMSKSKYGDSTIKWGESHFPDMSRPVELLPIEAVNIDEWIKKPKLTVNEDGYAYRDFSLTICIDFDMSIIGPDGKAYRIVSGDAGQLAEMMVSRGGDIKDPDHTE